MSSTYCSLLRPDLHYRREVFDKGLRAVGLKPTDEKHCDILLIWNRYGRFEAAAEAVEARGGKVLVAENATWGNGFLGGKWLSVWPSFHNRKDCIRYFGPERWDEMGVTPMDWRPGGERVGLGQRGIGPRGTPKNWVPRNVDRVRKHPGVGVCVPLDVDLAKCGTVVTWGSGAAVKALMWGIRVESHMPKWCGEQQNTYESRLEMFRRLAWAQYTLSEIEMGEPFARLL